MPDYSAFHNLVAGPPTPSLGEMRGGDIIFFAGAGFLSDVIDLVTHSQVSHSAMILDPDLVIDGVPQHLGNIPWTPNIIESTVLNGISGPQINRLDQRMTNYGAGVWWCPLSDEIRNLIHWPLAWAFALAKLKGDRYNTAELAMYLARHVPGIQSIPELYKSDPHAEVCSEFLAMILQAGGLPGLNPAIIPPQKLAELKIYRECVQLTGKSSAIRNFNTV